MMTDLIRREDAIKIIANKQRELCPPGRYSRNAVYGSDREKFDEWEEILDAIESVPAVGERDTKRLGKWVELNGAYLTPGGTPCYVCGSCGGSAHLHGVEYPRKKMICDNCGRVNIYPWERAYEEGSSLWETDGGENNAAD